MSKIENPVAFPCNSPDGAESYKGMDLRDYFAAKAMQGELFGQSYQQSEMTPSDKWPILVKAAYKIADAMLKQRTK